MSETKSQGSARRVLVVEDELLLAMLLEDMLTDLGFTIAGSASRVEDALSLVGTAEFDLAILDVNLAGRTVVPVAEVLAGRGIPFIFSTGEGRPPDPFLDRPILRKPFVLNDLERALAHVTGG